ncbi:MAG: hypothetical protein Q7L19_08795, partial [Pseudohongiella sp.]|nr:hypothetical protein [Pseudohongiella sp.]
LSIQTFNETKQGGKRWQKEEQLNHNWAQQAGQFSVQLVGQIWMQFNRPVTGSGTLGHLGSLLSQSPYT